MSTRIYKEEVTYFIQGEITQRIKIGKTSTAVRERIRLLQTGSPDILKFLGVCIGIKRSESVLHREFSQYRLHGEWFSPEPEIFEYIKGNCITDERAFFHAYQKIENGDITFEDALSIGTDELKLMSENAFRDTLNNMYVNDDGYNVLTGKKT